MLPFFKLPRWSMELPWLPSATSVLQPLEQVVTAFVAPPVATPEKSFDVVPGVPRAPGDDTMLSQWVLKYHVFSSITAPSFWHSHMSLASSICSKINLRYYLVEVLTCWPMEVKEGLLWWHATNIYQLSMLHLLHLGKLARWRWDWFLSWPLQVVMPCDTIPVVILEHLPEKSVGNQ